MSEESSPQKSSYHPPQGVSSESSLKLGGSKKLEYRAEANWIVLRKKEKPVAEMFYVAYVKKEASASKRPITFVFNGGPGAAAAFLHLGSLGPKLVLFEEDGTPPPPPAELRDNPDSWLAFTDLVFVDPIGTGFSRTTDDDQNSNRNLPKEGQTTQAGSEGENKEFFQLNRDLDSLCDFIQKFLSQSQRWSSPVFICGESYGGFRVGKLSRKLQESYGVGLNGAILISPALELSNLTGSNYDVASWVDLFPTLVATAHHHGKSNTFSRQADLGEVLSRSESFATTELSHYLLLGESLNSKQRDSVIQTASNMLGVSEDFVQRRGGRVGILDFQRELLKDRNRVCGLYDGTVSAVDPFPGTSQYQGMDPTLIGIQRVYNSGINTQLRENLGLKTERDYRLLNFDVFSTWKNDSRNHDLEVQIGATDDLRAAMALNPTMQIFITHGYFDMVTPYFASNRIASLMQLQEEQKKNITLKHFMGGHMFYAWKQSRQAFAKEIGKFYSKSTF